MPVRVELLPVSDFMGGLNYKADAFQLRGSETPDCLNVDFDPRGGFALRDSVAPLGGNSLSVVAKNIWVYANIAGTKQVVVQQGNDIASSTGGSWTTINPDALTTTGIMHAAEMKDALYIQRNTEQTVIKYTGSPTSAMGTTFNDDLAAPNNGDVPLAKFICVWGGYMWIGHTKESGTSFPSRVRWSHPNFPEDWRSFDFIDVDIGKDGDEITALVPFGDMLLVFKHNSIYAIRGYDPTTFAVVPISDKVGAISQEAVAATDHGVYFFSWPEGVFLFDGKSIDFLFERIEPILTNGVFNRVQFSQVALGWLKRRLWVSVPTGSSSTNNRVFVYDPTLGGRGRGMPDGGWTVYDIPAGAMLEWQPYGAEALQLICHPTVARVLTAHQSAATDDLGAGAVNITSNYTTRWFDNEQPAVVKRWRRPELVVDGDIGVTIRVDVWRDYDPSFIKRTLFYSTDALTSGLIWDDGSAAANMRWDNGNVWSADVSDSQEVHRLVTLGRGRAVRLKFTGPTPSNKWAVNAVTFKYVNKRVR